MKKAGLLLCTFILIAIVARAQDVITLTSGTQLQSKVLEITPTEVKYKDYNNLDGPTTTIMKTSVAYILYANGTKTIFNELSTPKSNDNGRESSVDFKKDPYTKDRQPYKKGYNKKGRHSPGLYGWYFGVDLNLGGSNATSTDPTYTTSAGGYSGALILATKMFSPHLGIQFGLGSEDYQYNVTDPTGQYVPDNANISCFVLPVRAIYFSNTKGKVGFYATGGFDISFIGAASNQDSYDISSYYRTTLFTPYVNCGVAIRNRTDRRVWMIGPFYKTSVNNIYSPGAYNTGTLHSVGLSVAVMSKLGR